MRLILLFSVALGLGGCSISMPMVGFGHEDDDLAAVSAISAPSGAGVGTVSPLRRTCGVDTTREATCEIAL